MLLRDEKMDTINDPEPRWLAGVAMLAVGLLFGALPGYLSVGPRWLLLLVIAVLLVPTVASHRAGHHNLAKVLGFAASTILTAAMIWSIALLVQAIPKHEVDPKVLLRSAVALWATNILVFALWYWRLDAGGPHEREKRERHEEGAFLFPQMTPGAGPDPTWSPTFVDYLFLAFNTSTALSPADTAALSRWAKILMMIQATISLVVVVLLAARAVGIL